MVASTALNWERCPVESAPVDLASLRAKVAATIDGEVAHSSEPAVAKLLSIALKRYLEGSDLPWDAKVAGVAALAVKDPEPLLDLTIAEAGFAGALDALIVSATYGRYGRWNEDNEEIRENGKYEIDPYHARLWQVLREKLLRAPAAAYELAREHAQKLRARPSLLVRCAIAYAFPAEASWAAEEFAPYVGVKDPPAALLLLLPSLDATDLLEKLADTKLEFAPAFADGRVATVVRRFGVAALPFAKRLFVKRSGRPAVVEALVQFESPEIAALLATIFSDSAVRDAIANYYREYPALGLLALTKASIAKKDDARLMAPLLASIVAANRPLAMAKVQSASPKEKALLASLGVTDTWVPTLSPAIEKILSTPIDDAAARPAWDALAAWVRARGPGKESACLHEAARVAGPTVTGLLADLARATAKHGGAACALAIVDALEVEATTAAVREIARIAIDLTEPSLTEHAEAALRRLQRQLGLDDEDILDRAVPDFGVRSAAIVLDFGPRAFRVELDGTFTPRLEDERGGPLKSLPRPNKKDDPTMAAHAAAVWAALRDEGTAEARQQAKRFEAAMVAGRSWRAQAFREVLLAHPILARIAMRVVWATRDGRTFRVAEDASLADVHDAAFVLSDEDEVRIVHRLELGERGNVAWANLFAEYEILPPFEQLSREVTVLEDTSSLGIEGVLAGFERKALTRAARHVLEAQGWTDNYHYDHLTFTRTLRGHEASVDLELPAPDASPTTLLSASLTPPGDKADPIALSEVLRDLSKIVLREER